MKSDGVISNSVITNNTVLYFVGSIAFVDDDDVSSFNTDLVSEDKGFIINAFPKPF
jgi:hypothetical protein